MVEDHVHDQFNPLSARFQGEGTVLLIASVAGIHLVKVSSGVTMVGNLMHVVLQKRIEPYRRKTHSGNIIEVIPEPLYVASLASLQVSSVGFFLHSRHFVIIGIPVGKAVGHHQIHHVAAVESLTFCRSCFPFLQLVAVHGQVFPFLLEENIKFSGGCLPQVKVDKEVIRIFHGSD